MDALRKQARVLENEIDVKLVAFSKVSNGAAGSSGPPSSTDTSPLLGEHVFDTLSNEIAGMLDKLSALNESMAEFPSHSTTAMHTLQRHREILQGYRQEFNKLSSNHSSRIEREELLRGSGIATSSMGSPLTSGLSRRDMYMKESNHIASSSSLLNDQINIAIETKEHLMSQRHSFKRLQTRFNDMSNRYPLINSLIQRIHIKKRRDSLILGTVIAVCTFLLFLYAFS